MPQEQTTKRKVSATSQTTGDDVEPDNMSPVPAKRKRKAAFGLELAKRVANAVQDISCGTFGSDSLSK